MAGVLDVYENSKAARERKELLSRATILYRSTRDSFLELPAKCLELQDELEKRGLKSKLQMKAVYAYPAATKLFSFKTELALKNYFGEEPIEALERLVRNTEDTLSESWAYHTLKNWAVEAAYNIKRYDEKKLREDHEREWKEQKKVIISEASMWT